MFGFRIQMHTMRQLDILNLQTAFQFDSITVGLYIGSHSIFQFLTGNVGKLIQYVSNTVLVHGQVTIIFVVSVCLFVCAEFFSAVFDPISIKLGYMLLCLGLVVSLEYRGCATPGDWVTPKNLYFRGFGAQETISSYSFDRIVLIFGYIVEHTNTKIISSHFLQFPS